MMITAAIPPTTTGQIPTPPGAQAPDVISHTRRERLGNDDGAGVTLRNGRRYQIVEGDHMNKVASIKYVRVRPERGRGYAQKQTYY